MVIIAVALSFGAAVAQGKDSIFNVREFGAAGDGVANDSISVKQAIDAAIQWAKKEKKAATVLLPAGQYALGTAFGKNQMLEFGDAASDITIQGEANTAIIIKSPEFGFIHFEGGQNIQVKNISIDYSPLPFTQLEVMSNDGEQGGVSRLTVRTEDGFPDLDSLKSKVFISYTADRMLNVNAPLLAYKGHSRLTSDKFSLSLGGFQGNPKFVKQGDILVVAARLSSKNLFRFSRVHNIRLEDIRAYAGPEVFLLSDECEGLVIRHTRVAPPENTSRILSTCADGVFVVGGRKGPTIEDCYFAGNGDDSVNIHMTGGHIYGFASDNELVTLEHPWVRKSNFIPLWRVGDVVELYNNAFERVFKATIVEISYDERENRPVTKIKFDPLQKNYYCAEHLIKENPLADKANPNLIAINVNKCGNNFVIKNNVFRNHRGRGILVQSRNGVIEGNTFSEMDSGILFVGESRYGDGPLAEDILVRGNSFVNLGRHVSKGAITMCVFTKDPNQSMGYSGIQILGNKFSKCLNPAVYLNNATDILIQGNSIEAVSADNQVVTGSVTRDIHILDNATVKLEK